MGGGGTPEETGGARGEPRAPAPYARTVVLAASALLTLVVGGHVLTQQTWVSHTVLVLAPVLLFASLWAGYALRRRRTGGPAPAERFGLIALLLLATTLWPVPLVSVATGFTGGGTVLGIVLAVLGWRWRDARAWAPGLVLTALSPVTHLWSGENQLGGAWPWVVGASYLALAGWMMAGAVSCARQERRAGRSIEQPVG